MPRWGILIFSSFKETAPLVNKLARSDIVWDMMTVALKDQVQEQAGETDFDLLFTHKEIDHDLGLHYFGARYYAASDARFTSPDPVGGTPTDPLSWNRYLYCKNDPINYFDPDGRKTWPYSWKGWVGGIAGGVGFAMMFTPAAVPGTILFVAGSSLLLYDTYDGFLGEEGAFETGKKLGHKDLLNKINTMKTLGYTVQQAQKEGILPSNEQLLAAGYSVKELRMLGFVVEDDDEDNDKDKDGGGVDIVVPKDEPNEGA